MDLYLDRIVFAKLHPALREVQLYAAFACEPGHAQKIEFGEGAAQWRRNDIDIYIEMNVWKQASGDLDEFCLLFSIRHRSKDKLRALWRGLSLQRGAINLHQCRIEFLERRLGRIRRRMRGRRRRCWGRGRRNHLRQRLLSW